MAIQRIQSFVTMEKVIYEDILTRASVIHYSRPEDKDQLQSVKFAHQVAGHFNEVILSLSSTKILKPIIKPDLFQRELLVYEKSQQLKDPMRRLFLATFMCRYYGVFVNRDPLTLQINSLYLILDDLTSGFRKPCICDIKMGTQTYEPTADPEKIRSRINKYRYQAQFGFRISGLKVYDITTQTYLIQDKHFGRSATPENISSRVGSFFHNGRYYRKDVLFQFIQELEILYQYMQRQTDFMFYSSSLLFIYEGDMSDSQTSTDIHVPTIGSQSRVLAHRNKQCVLKMIDFAHTIESSTQEENSIDQGYVFGLRNLLDIFYRLHS